MSTYPNDHPHYQTLERVLKLHLEKYGEPCLVIDFGSATTYDVINETGDFIGGAIAPGIDVSANYLIKKAALLNKAIFQFPDNVIGKNTKSAIRSGFYHGYIGLIDNIIKLIIKQTGKSYKIILTGGLAHLFKNSIKGKTIVNKNLTINGILKAASKLK